MDIRKSKKSLRSRCANPECDQQFRHARSSRKWCSEACRKVVSRQSKRRAAVGALVRVLAAVAVKRQDAKAATDAQQARAMAKMESNLAAHLRKEAEQQAAEQQQVAEQERARPRTPTPPAGPITVTFAPAPMFPGTPLPPGQQPPWR